MDYPFIGFTANGRLKLQIGLKMENEQIKMVQNNSFGW